MATQTATRVPFFVPIFNPLARRLLGRGVPMGPNALLTVRGRKSGIDRTTPVSVIKIGGQRWVIGTFGDTNWVRNLRAAGEGRVAVGRRREQVKARELTHDQATEFFAQVVGPYVRSLAVGPLLLKMLNAGDILDDPAGSADRRPVFELRVAA